MSNLLMEKGPHYERYINEAIKTRSSNFSFDCMTVIRYHNMAQLRISLVGAVVNFEVLVAAHWLDEGTEFTKTFQNVHKAVEFYNSLVGRK